MRLDLNPEFRRNLWLQFGWQRLTAAIVVGVTAAYAVYLTGDFSYLGYAANLAATVILGMWGPRRAADALAEEVAGGTWEVQRMSGLSAWSMAWGKLVGGCSFVWFCGLLALAIYVIAGFHQGFPPGQAGNFWLGLYLILVGAGLAHASALVIGLILLRKSVPHRRFSITFAQACGFVVYLMVSGSMVTRGSPDEAAADGVGYFFSYEFEWPVIRAVLGTALLAWSIIAVLRLMRSELQYRAWPWLWALFLVFCTILAAGMSPWPGSGLVGTVLALLAALVALTYLSALADRRDPIRYRSGMAALRRCDFGRAFAELPCWLVSFSAAAIAASFAVMVLPLTGQDSWPGSISELLLHLSFLSPAHIASAVLLVLLFATRDIMVLLWLSFGSWRQRADMAWLVYLALVYWPAGIILTFAGHPGYLPAVLPVAGDDAILNFAPILVQLAASFLMLLHSWRKATTNRGAA